MKITEGIKSNVKPAEIEYTETTIYKRINIEESIEIDPVFNTENTIYTYDEMEYPLVEAFKIMIKKLENAINELRLEVEELKGRD